ncbi:hypothetical protein CcCBS67573_g04783 [Chytriomyces confervae]|uniref:Uncharacterized protein n=1 Tax=Chytriomyces confervae TaxID=246404 RepID=A0A507FCK9_9FUNG|nr:hypothetical protein CcCBS67573_g04783 [Chytriomyces confervae]
MSTTADFGSSTGATLKTKVSFSEKHPVIQAQVYLECFLALISLALAIFTCGFIWARDLTARGVSRTCLNALNPSYFLLVPSFLGLFGFFTSSALYVSGVMPMAGFSQFFFIGIIHSCDTWYGWLRANAVVRLHFSKRMIQFLQVELCLIPILFALPCVLQFTATGIKKNSDEKGILNNVRIAGIVMAGAIAAVTNVDLNSMYAFVKQMTSLQTVGMKVPAAYQLIAKYSCVSTGLSLTALCLYSVANFVSSPVASAGMLIAMDFALVSTPGMLLLMKIALVAPGLIGAGSGGEAAAFFAKESSKGGKRSWMSAKSKTRGFLEGTAESGLE